MSPRPRSSKPATSFSCWSAGTSSRNRVTAVSISALVSLGEARRIQSIDRSERSREDDHGQPQEGPMARLMADCRRFPSESNCSLVIIGEEDEVVRAAAEHAASVHGHEDTPELREQLRGLLEPADAYTPGPREQEQIPA